jgi:predicted O-linked N-acetylglucosamine transferase (SPINDLY family)
METIAGVFMAWLKQAITQQLPIAELMAAAERLSAVRSADLAVELYKAWLSHNAGNPLAYAILFNYGVLLNDQQRTSEAHDAFSEAIRLNPSFLPARINLGTALERMGNLEDAVSHWNHVVEALAAVNPDNLNYRVTALKQIGRVLESAQRDWQAEQTLRQSLELNPRQHDVIQHWVALRQGQCKWPVIEPWGGVTRLILLGGMSPLSMASYLDDPMFQLATAYHYHAGELTDLSTPFTVGRFAAPEGAGPRRLRIGYVSSDLRHHAVGLLTAELYELHDRARVEVFAYYTGPAMDDETQRRIKRTVDHWREISGVPDKQAARMIVADEIDILVDLNGYTRDGRSKLFALRPAPVIVNWLGFPGTMGTPHHDYIIADAHIIPPESERYFSETVVRLPCYQPTDRKRVVAPVTPSREEALLPRDGTVFCCFNGHQKITAPVFARWMAILAAVPGSVLWLLRTGEATMQRLHQAAEAAGIDPARVVFAEKKNNAEHLARYPLADLFLDTAPYGAHTTTSDALWMGVPVLTVSGRGFASRVCGSLVRAAGFPELICADFDSYQRRAIELGTDRAALRALRARVMACRAGSVLFDTPGLVRALEGLYERMWQDFLRGEIPLPDLRNLDVYHTVGCESAETIAQAPDDAGFRAGYEAALAYRHRVSPLPPDRRLWSEAAIRRLTGAPPAAHGA